MSNNICYWCGKPATSKEHVPPKCLFPELRDSKLYSNKNFRNNLITVPSCEEHNSKKFNDDEYLMTCLAGGVGNNNIAYYHNSTKVNRTRIRNKKIVDVLKDLNIKTKTRDFPVQIIEVDNSRLMNSFEAIARGLYFYEYQTIFLGECLSISELYLNPLVKEWINFTNKSIKLIEYERHLWNTDLKGKNKEVFSYQFGPIDEFDCQTLILTFYENIKVYVVLSKLTDQIIEENKERFKSDLKILFGKD